MTRERKELFRQLDELDRQEQAELELGCGYSASDFGLPDPFREKRSELTEKLAKTYGLTADEYFAREMELGLTLYALGTVPYN